MLDTTTYLATSSYEHLRLRPETQVHPNQPKCLCGWPHLGSSSIWGNNNKNSNSNTSKSNNGNNTETANNTNHDGNERADKLANEGRASSMRVGTQAQMPAVRRFLPHPWIPLCSVRVLVRYVKLLTRVRTDKNRRRSFFIRWAKIRCAVG